MAKCCAACVAAQVMDSNAPLGRVLTESRWLPDLFVCPVFSAHLRANEKGIPNNSVCSNRIQSAQLREWPFSVQLLCACGLCFFRLDARMPLCAAHSIHFPCAFNVHAMCMPFGVCFFARNHRCNRKNIIIYKNNNNYNRI